MKNILILAIIAFVMSFLIYEALAGDNLSAHVRWNCENIHTGDHPLPVDFTIDASGSWDVLLSDDSMLYGERKGDFMVWTWEDAWWTTDGHGVVYCETLLKSMSILLAQ